ncbi:MULTISPECIES: holo-ACP synthase [unclassified Variovorax]|jgi:holo-[acyl-carrier protein] synthase|uniref:holo-ACP synthase n=1 Tax=unclassified Variovorax TaxID=663243 RepID=UPI001BD39FBE|nr:MULTISPECIES: holo-ACP synthase [unclassified Variovorax]
MPTPRRQDPASSLRLGVDLVDVHAIEDSLAEFGDRFVHRIFSRHEIEISNGSPERLAARFAAKEAVIKALDLAELGVDWRNIEVRSSATGRPGMRLAGNVAARARELGAHDIMVSLSQEGSIAMAAVIAQIGPEPTETG